MPEIEPVMAFCGGSLRVVLATWHVPLAKVPGLLEPRLLERTVRAALDLSVAEGIKQPRIGICGLNPHAGESGILGREEMEVINPALNARIDWPWFYLTQIAFGLVAGFVVARSSPIATFQHAPLAVRAGLETQDHDT